MEKLQGFTLIQLLAAVALLSMLAGISVPAFQNLLERKRLHAATQSIYDDLKRAQSESLKTRTAIFVSFSPGSSWCYGLDSTGTCDCATSNSCKLGNTEYVVSSSSFKDTSIAITNLSGGSPKYVRFNGLRGVVSNTGSITVSLGSKTAVLSINGAGSVTICSDTLHSYNSC